MTHIEKIKNIIDKHNGIVTSAMLTQNNIPRLYLKKMTDSGELIYLSWNICQSQCVGR